MSDQKLNTDSSPKPGFLKSAEEKMEERAKAEGDKKSPQSPAGSFSKQEKSTKKCPYCGKSLPNYARKCKYCDTRLESSDETSENSLLQTKVTPNITTKSNEIAAVYTYRRENIMDSQKGSFQITNKTTWILGAGASYDCIGPNRICVPITRSLFIPGNTDKGLVNDLCQLFGVRGFFREREIHKMLGQEMELTFDKVRKACKEVEKKQLAEKILKELTDKVAERIRDAQIQSTLAHGGSVGFIYCAENYLWVASRTCHFEGWSVITLNYDTLLDRAYEELAVRGFPVPPYQNWIDLIDNHFAHKEQNYVDFNAYVKLHGSLDIYYCLNPNCRSYRRPFSMRLKPQVREFLVESIGPTKNPECKTCGQVTSEFILPPGENKIDPEWAFHNMAYTQAKIALTNTFSWIFLGYSFPEYDKDIINLLRGELHNARLKNLERSIGVISPDAIIVAKRMSSILDYPVHPIKETFSHFVDNIMAMEGNERPGLA